MPKVDSKRFVECYNFWRWEYVRRNNEHYQLVKSVFNGNIPPHTGGKRTYNAWGRLISIGSYLIRLYYVSLMEEYVFNLENAKKIKIPLDCLHRKCEIIAELHPVPDELKGKARGRRKGFPGYDEPEIFSIFEMTLYHTAQEIVNAILTKQFKYVYPILADDFWKSASDKYIYWLQFSSVRLLEAEFFHIMPYEWVQEMLAGQCELPLTPVGDVVNGNIEMDFIGTPEHWKQERQEVVLSKYEELLLVDMSKDIEEIVSDIRMCYNAFHKIPDYQRQERDIRSAGNIERMPRDLPRAIGIWLWDYVEEKKIPWEHRTKSYAAFREQYQNPSKPDMFIKGYTKDTQLAELLSKTRECIEKMEVLPMG